MKNWKKKVLSCTLAVALIGGSLLGSIGSAVASDPLPASAATLISKLNAVYAYLTPTEKNAIDVARAAIQTRIATPSSYTSISAPIWTKINAKINGSTAYPNINPTSVLVFGLSFASINYDPTFNDLAVYRASPGFIDLVADLKNLAAVSGTVDFADITSFYLSIESATKNAVASLPTVTGVLDLVSFKNAMQTEIQSIIDAQQTNIAKIFYNIDIEAADLLSTKTNVALSAPVVFDAEVALARAYQAMIIAANSGGGGGDGGDNTPAPILTPGGTTLPEQASEVAKEVLKELAEKLADLPAAEKKAEVKKAEKAVEKAIKEAAKSVVTSVITAGVAKPTINTTELVNKAKEAKTLANELNKDLEAAGGKKVKIEFTMDLGTIDADTTEIPFDKAFMDAMSDAGVDSIALLVNGVEISVNTKEFGANTTLKIEKKTKAESGDTSGKVAASEYYEFDFTSNGSNVGQFNNPVVLRIPVKDVANYDTDLLTLAKVQDGKLIYYVGKYNAETGSVEGSRDSFSTYVIVENKVVFNDIALVKRWAGRSIEVAAAKGVIVGRAEGEFVPTANVTRAEFAKMLVTAFSLSSFNTSESFDDVSDTNWFKPYVATAFSNGIISGRTASTFDPNASITRQEMAAMVARILKSSLDATDATDANAELSIYSDADKIASGFRASVALATEQGILTGSAGTFKPLGITTRAEAAVVISKLIELL